jgi:SAM-dependent methyltransferase
MLPLVLTLAPISFLLAVAASFVVLRLSRRLGALDTEPIAGQIKAQRRAIPNTGGIAIAIGIFVPMIAALAAVSAHAAGLLDLAAILPPAAAVAAAAGLANVEVREMDGEHLELADASFDAVISRVGLIYFPDQQRALREIHRVLRPGGRFSAIVYSTPDCNPFFSIPVGIIRRIAGLPAPAPGLPGPFSLGSPGALESAYATAGFEAVDVRPLDAPVRFPTAAECVRFERESFGALHAMLADVTPGERDAAWREIEAELRQFEGGEGFEGPCQLLIGSARRGA